MIIPRKKQCNYARNLDYPVVGDDVQKDLDDTDSITFSRFVSKKAVVMCANRLEYIMANNPDDFDIDVELSNLHETLRFVEKNLKVAGGIGNVYTSETLRCKDSGESIQVKVIDDGTNEKG